MTHNLIHITILCFSINTCRMKFACCKYFDCISFDYERFWKLPFVFCQCCHFNNSSMRAKIFLNCYNRIILVKSGRTSDLHLLLSAFTTKCTTVSRHCTGLLTFITNMRLKKDVMYVKKTIWRFYKKKLLLEDTRHCPTLHCARARQCERVFF